MAGILFVSETNVCRSVLSERILQHALTEVWGDDLNISSAGTSARVDEPMDTTTAKTAASLGVDSMGHGARPLTREQLSAASLVLTATRAQRSAVVRVGPVAVRYTLTLRQFARLLGSGRDLADLPTSGEESLPERISYVLSAAVKRRGKRSRFDPSVDDILDPYGQPTATHELAARQLVPAVNRLAWALGGKPLPWDTDLH